MSQDKKTFLLIEDPIRAATWMLKQLPLETCATYLALLLAHGNECGIVPPEDYVRIKNLADDILSDKIYRAA
jgi:hypothetical protein